MKINLTKVTELVKLGDMDSSEYFWWNSVLYLKPELGIKDNAHFQRVEGFTFAILLENECLVMISNDVHVLVEDRRLAISLMTDEDDET